MEGGTDVKIVLPSSTTYRYLYSEYRFNPCSAGFAVLSRFISKLADNHHSTTLSLYTILYNKVRHVKELLQFSNIFRKSKIITFNELTNIFSYF